LKVKSMAEINLKNRNEIEVMRAGGKISARVLEILEKAIKPGITTESLDALAKDEILKAGGKPAFKGYGGFPANICVSINDEVVHGIPSDRIIQEGDLVGIDLGTLFRGYYTDTAITVPCGKIDAQKQKLLQVTKKALNLAIKAIRPGKRLGDIQAVIQNTIENAGFGVIRDLSGHGIGKNLQDPPSVPNFGKAGLGPVLKEGMTLAIEPMVSEGDWRVKVLADAWTVVTLDKSPSAHSEHTIVVTATGAEVLTKL